MAEQRNRWSWDVTGFEPWKSSSPQTPSSPAADYDDRRPNTSLVRRYSISSASSVPPQHKNTTAVKLQRLNDKVKLAKDDYLQLRQEASELQEYSNAKLDRVTRYLGVLAEKTRKLDQIALETEARISPVINEKKRLFNDLLTSKGSIRVFCRTRPLFEDEGPSVVDFPDDYTIRVNTGDESLANSKKDFEFDKVYGPHVGQAELFSDVQPLVQSALDGYNVSIFAYGQTHSGKTHTMEGSSYDRGLYARCFEELFDLANLDTTSTSQYKFCVTVCELYNEQTRDLLLESGKNMPTLSFGADECFVELVQEKVNNPLEFTTVLKTAFRNRGNDLLKINVSHLIVTMHIFYNNSITGENSYSKLYLVDLAGSEGSITEDDSGERVTDLLHVMKSLSALGDVLSSLTSKKDIIPYENSMLTKLLADSLGGSSKTLMIVNVCPSVSNLSETLMSLNFSARARNSVLSLGNRDTIKKWRDVANDARKELYEKEKEILDLKQEGLGLKQALKDANDQCVLLFNEVQKAWKVSSALQTDLKSEHILLSDKYKIEKEESIQLRNQVAQLLQLEQDQKLQIQQQDSTIHSLQISLLFSSSSLHSSMAASVSPMKRLYLSLYNFTVLFGWLQVLFLVLKTLKEMGHQHVYSVVEKPLLYAQTAAVLEILHGLVGIVKSPISATLPQIGSRLFLVWGILWSFPETHTHFLVSSLLISWSITEIIRYSFFGLKEAFGFSPSWLLWLRYSTFLILYPTGISSEVGLIYIALPFIKASEKYCIRMPNTWNSSFDYFYLAIVSLAIYVPGSPHLYSYMLSQRKKALAKAKTA